MPQTPLLPGVPISPRNDGAAWFAPVAADDVAEPSAAMPSPRQATAGHEVSWVGFAGDGETPIEVNGAAAVMANLTPPGDSDSISDGVIAPDASPPEPGLALIATPGPPAVMEPPRNAEGRASRRSASGTSIAARGLHLWRRAGAGAGQLLRLAVVAAAMGAVAVFAYQGGERLAGLTGATNSAAAPGHPAVALPVPPVTERAPPVVRRDPAGSPSERAAYYLDQARAGDPVAQYNVAVLYARGDGLPQDFASALAWFRDAATAGNAAAQFNLAVMYERGLGVGQNMAEAIAWYRRAAEHDYLPAQHNLAMAYAEGRGTPRDAVAAAHWYQQAAAQGLIPAMVNYAILCEKGEGAERSWPEAYAWYRAAARGGDDAAERRARELFQQFTGADKGRAVIAAAAVADTVKRASGNRISADRASAAEPSPSPAASPAKAAVPSGPVPTLRPGGWIGRKVLEAKPVSTQPAG